MLGIDQKIDLANLILRLKNISDIESWKKNIIGMLEDRKGIQLRGMIEETNTPRDYIMNTCDKLNELPDTSIEDLVAALFTWSGEIKTPEFIEVAKYWSQLSLTAILQDSDIDIDEMVVAFNVATPTSHNSYAVESFYPELELIKELWKAEKKFPQHHPLLRFIVHFDKRLPNLDEWFDYIEKYTNLEINNRSYRKIQTQVGREEYVVQILISPVGSKRGVKRSGSDRYTFKSFFYKRPQDLRAEVTEFCPLDWIEEIRYDQLAETIDATLYSDGLNRNKIVKVELFMPIENMIDLFNDNPIDQIEIEELKLFANVSVSIRPLERIQGSFNNKKCRARWEALWDKLFEEEAFEFEIRKSYFDEKEYVNVKKKLDLRYVSCYGLFTQLDRRQHCKSLSLLIEMGLPVILWIHENEDPDCPHPHIRINEIQAKFKQAGLLLAHEEGQAKAKFTMRNFESLHSVIDSIRRDKNQFDDDVNHPLAQSIAFLFDNPYRIPT